LPIHEAIAERLSGAEGVAEFDVNHLVARPDGTTTVDLRSA